MFICILWQWKSNSNKFSQSLTLPKVKYIVQTVMWEIDFVGENYNVITNVHVYILLLHGLLYALVIANAMLH